MSILDTGVRMHISTRAIFPSVNLTYDVLKYCTEYIRGHDTRREYNSYMQDPIIWQDGGRHRTKRCRSNSRSRHDDV